MKNREYKKRRYMIDPDFQYGIIRKIAFLSSMGIIISLSFLTLIHYLYGDVQLALLQPDPFTSSETLDTLAMQRNLIDLLWPVLSVCVLVALVITFVLGIIISHRMAGPIFRIRKILLAISEGELRGRIRLRKKDDFKSLAEAVNTLNNSLTSTIDELHEVYGKLEVGDDSRKKDALKAFHGILSRFKTG